MAIRDFASMIGNKNLIPDDVIQEPLQDFASMVTSSEEKKKLDYEQEIRKWLRDTYTGTQNPDQIEITPQLQARYEKSKITAPINKQIMDYYDTLGDIDNPTTPFGAASQTAEDVMRLPVTATGKLVSGATKAGEDILTDVGYGLNKLFGKKYGQGVRPIGVPDEIVAAPKETGLNKTFADVTGGLKKVSTIADLVAEQYGIDPTRHPEVAQLVGGAGEMVGGLAPYMGMGPLTLPVAGAIQSSAETIREGGRYGNAGKVFSAGARGSAIGGLDAAIFHGTNKLLPTQWGKIASALGFGTVHELNKDLQEGKITPPDMDTLISMAQAFVLPSGKESEQRKVDRELLQKREQSIEDYLANQKTMRDEYLAKKSQELAQQTVSESPTTKLVQPPEMIPPEQSTTSVLKPAEQSTTSVLKPEQTISTPPEQPVVAPQQKAEKPIEQNMLPNKHAERVADKAREVNKTTKDLEDMGVAEIIDNDIATHPKKNMLEHSEKSSDFVASVKPEVVDAILRGAPPPSKLLSDGLPLSDVDIWVAGKNKAIRDGDVERMLEFARDTPTSRKISQAGTTLNTLRNRSPEDPVYQIMEINKEGKAAKERIWKSPEQKKAVNERIWKLEKQIETQSKRIEQYENKKAIESMRYETRKKGRKFIKKELDSEYNELTSLLIKEIGNPAKMQSGIDPIAFAKSAKLISRIAINRVESGFKTIEQIVDDIHMAIKGSLDKRQIRDIITGYGKQAKLSKDEIDVQLREIKRTGRIISAIEDAEKGKAPLRSGLQRDIDTPRVTELKKQLKESMVKNGFAIDKNQLDQQWESMRESGTGKKLFINPEDQQRTEMDKLRKHLEKREADLKRKIDEGDYGKKSPKKVMLDKEMKETKLRIEELEKEYKNKFSKQYENLHELSTKKQDAIDRANENKQFSDWYVGLHESSIKKSFPTNKEPVSAEEQQLTITARYKKHLESRESELRHKLITGNYESKQKVKTPLDTQMEATKGHLDRISKIHGQLKRIKEISEHGVTKEDALEILNFSKIVTNKKVEVKDWNDRSTDGPALEYGRALADFIKYTGDIKMKLQKRSWSEIKGHMKGQPFIGTLQETGRGILKAGGVSKSILSSMDDSALGRQGIKVFWNDMATGNHIWRKNALQSFKDLANQFKGKDVMREVQADILSRPNMINGRYTSGGKFGKLDFSNMEEAYPEQAHEGLRVVGRAFKASDVAFTAFQYRTRADTADFLFNTFEKMGIKLDKEQIGGICKLANSLTGRGDVKSGRLMNNLFFSPKFLKSNYEFLTDWANPNRTDFVRKQALKSLVRYSVGTMGTMLVLHAIAPKAIELDPASADWGKVRVGDTRFDITGGVGPMVTLTRRLGTALLSSFVQGFGGKPLMATKSSTTGEYSALTTGKGFKKTAQDITNQFVAGKLGPVPGALYRQGLTGVDINRKPINLLKLGLGLITPLILQDAYELIASGDPEILPVVLVADFFGIGVNTYGGKEKKSGNNKTTYTGGGSETKDFASMLR